MSYCIKSKLIVSLVILILFSVLMFIIWSSRTNRIVGGIVYKPAAEGTYTFLLVTTKSQSRWIFPKGKTGFFESSEAAVRREVNEEAGIIANKILRLENGPYIYIKSSGKVQEITFYLMEFLDDSFWKEKNIRKRDWLLVENASLVLSAELVRALNEANKLLKLRRKY